MYHDLVPARPSLADRVGSALAGIRDALDARGRLAWVAAMVIGFVAAWPVGLGILGYMIWSGRMFSTSGCRKAGRGMRFSRGSSGNTAFDAYRDDAIRRLEDEHADFLAFLEKLREAKDKAEFDAFMESRRPKAEA